MSRVAPYIGGITALIIGILLVVISGSVTVLNTPAPVTSDASSTISVLPNPIPTPIILPNLAPEKSIATSSPTEKKSTTKAVPVAKATVKPVSISAPTPPPPDNSAALDTSASTLRVALVNIICYAPPGTRLQSISGSGVIINPKGIILTNAHIAQYFLLADRNVSCKIRSGSPASDSYEASPIYIPSKWINANASVLTQSNPSGTGEYDFALLAITKSISRDALPITFQFIPLAITPPDVGTPIVIASYGAQFLEYNQIQSSLFPTIVFGSVKDIFTFASTTIDVIALGGSAAAQEGSSGGGVSNVGSELVGTITTSTIKGDTNTRSLDAITASYIRAEYARETGDNFNLLLTESTSTSINNFAPKMPALESVLTAQLN